MIQPCYRIGCRRRAVHILACRRGYPVRHRVVSRETLLDAQKNPEKYKHLVVRVAGYSAIPRPPPAYRPACHQGSPPSAPPKAHWPTPDKARPDKYRPLDFCIPAKALYLCPVPCRMILSTGRSRGSAYKAAGRAQPGQGALELQAIWAGCM